MRDKDLEVNWDGNPYAARGLTGISFTLQKVHWQQT